MLNTWTVIRGTNARMGEQSCRHPPLQIFREGNLKALMPSTEISVANGSNSVRPWRTERTMVGCCESLDGFAQLQCRCFFCHKSLDHVPTTISRTPPSSFANVLCDLVAPSERQSRSVVATKLLLVDMALFLGANATPSNVCRPDENAPNNTNKLP